MLCVGTLGGFAKPHLFILPSSSQLCERWEWLFTEEERDPGRSVRSQGHTWDSNQALPDLETSPVVPQSSVLSVVGVTDAQWFLVHSLN